MLSRRQTDEGASARDASPLCTDNEPEDCDAESAKVKRLALATAQLARAGFSLVRLPDDGFLVCRWMSAKELADLAAVEQFLLRVSP